MPSLFSKVENPIPKGPNELRIVWGGSATHLKDLAEIREAIDMILKKYDFAKFVMIGFCPKDFLDMNPNKVVFIKGTPNVIFIE